MICGIILALTYQLLEDRCIDDIIKNFGGFLYEIKQIDSMLSCVSSITDYRRLQTGIRTSVTHLVIALCATFLFLPHFDCQTATWITT